jgi:hypothetical protein
VTQVASARQIHLTHQEPKRIRTDQSAWANISGQRATRNFAREALVFAVFIVLTAAMTWPWVLHLRDAVADRGDPYMIAWTLWSDYHQTFHHPLHLFDANIFYPYHYTLAFSENDYGIALLFFPLFAAGVRPLTINSIATFLGFAFSGYGAFRLTRTLTGRTGAALISGVVFAFIPFRFHVLPHLHYLFAGWIPLLLESLVLFARQPTWKRASWMGAAFVMNALSCISWLIMTIVPLALTVIFLVITHESLRRNRDFWLRATVVLAVSALVLAPFIWPYFRVMSLYGLKWQPWEFAFNSPSLIHWLKAEPRNKVWQNLGATIPGGHKLFPGMIAPLLALASLRFRKHNLRSRVEQRLLLLIDLAIASSAIVAVLTIGYGDATYRLLGHRVIRLTDRSLNQAATVLVLSILVRIGLTLFSFVRRRRRNVQQATRDLDLLPNYYGTIGIGLIWLVTGFLTAMGSHVFFNRWLHDYLFLYQSIRIPARAAMVCYLGLALLAGAGASQLAGRFQQLFKWPGVQVAVIMLLGLALLFELHAAPLDFEKGEVDPSGLALRLKQTSMRGGVVELPSGTGESRHFYMLRAADHARPLVNATSSFISPITDEINKSTDKIVSPKFMDLLEETPASYLVIHNDRLPPGWETGYEVFLGRAVAAGRLRFINRFDGHDDLYAVVKTEPEAKQEAPLTFPLQLHEWSEMIKADPVNLLAGAARAQVLYRLYLAGTGKLPRYSEFVHDAETVARGVILEADDQDQVFRANLRNFASEWLSRQQFAGSLSELNDEQFVERLIGNAGLTLKADRRDALVSELGGKRENRGTVLLKVAGDPDFIDNENDRSLVLLHYFAYLRRNPGEPPDKDLSGFNFWIQDVAREHNPAKLAIAFRNSIEFRQRKPAK